MGKTPLLELTNLERQFGLKARLLAKLEYLNPAGSAKDRVAKYILNDAEEKGILTKDSVIVEPTSGNTGIGLAAIAAARRIPCDNCDARFYVSGETSSDDCLRCRAGSD